MNIVLKETEWAEDKIKDPSLGSKPFETLHRVARYYLDHNYSKKDVRVLLDRFLIQCDPTVSLPRWSDTLDNALARALKYDAINIDEIVITAPEMEKIDALDTVQTRRLAFVLLCLAKYWDAVNIHSDHWVNNQDKDIMRMANINTSIKRQSLMYGKLRDAGLIRFSKKVDNTSVRVCFIEDGEPVLRVTDFRNLGYQYLRYHGGNYFECENCGIVTKPNSKLGRRQKYCPDCAVKVATRQRVNAVMKNTR